MKIIRNLTASLLALGLILGPGAGLAADKKTAAQAKPYPLKTCIVTDEKLGEMGEAYKFVHEGQEYQLCCKSCLKDFNKNPKKFAAKLQKENAKAKGKK